MISGPGNTKRGQDYPFYLFDQAIGNECPIHVQYGVVAAAREALVNV